MNLNLLYPKYTELKKANPEFARRCIIKAYERLKSISIVARHFHSTRKTVRKILQRDETLKEGGLKDLSRRPKT